MDGHIGVTVSPQARGYPSRLHGTRIKFYFLLDSLQLTAFVTEMASSNAGTPEIRYTCTANLQARNRCVAPTILGHYHSLDSALSSLSGHQI